MKKIQYMISIFCWGMGYFDIDCYCNMGCSFVGEGWVGFRVPFCSLDFIGSLHLLNMGHRIGSY